MSQDHDPRRENLFGYIVGGDPDDQPEHPDPSALSSSAFAGHDQSGRYELGALDAGGFHAPLDPHTILSSEEENQLMTWIDHTYEEPPAGPSPKAKAQQDQYATLFSFGSDQHGVEPPPTFFGATLEYGQQEQAHHDTGSGNAHPGAPFGNPNATSSSHLPGHASSEVLGAASALFEQANRPPARSQDASLISPLHHMGPGWSSGHGMHSFNFFPAQLPTGTSSELFPGQYASHSISAPIISTQPSPAQQSPAGTPLHENFTLGALERRAKLDGIARPLYYHDSPESGPNQQPRHPLIQFGSDNSFGLSGFSDLHAMQECEREKQRIDRELRSGIRPYESRGNTRPSSPLQSADGALAYSHGRVNASPVKAQHAHSQSVGSASSGFEDQDTSPVSGRKRPLDRSDSAKSPLDAPSSNKSRKISEAHAGKQPSPPLKAVRVRGREVLTEAEKRQNHIQSEQRRRNLIKRQMAELEDMVPNVKGAGMSKSEVLKSTADFVEELREGNSEIEDLLGLLGTMMAHDNDDNDNGVLS